jgi:hypothetical protein
MRDPRIVIAQVHQGARPPGWRVFTKKRGAVRGFFSGTSNDPDPVLVFTTDAVIEYVSNKKPLNVIYFADLASVVLHAKATTTSDSMHAHLHVWLDLQYLNGAKAKWKSASFSSNLSVIQQFIEAHAVYKALPGRYS